MIQLSALLLALFITAGVEAEEPLLTFGYQLQKADPREIAASPFQVMVVDGAPFSREQISQMKAGGRRLLAYLSIGEAEIYRPYWRAAWAENPPSWLAEENPDWPGNFKVRYWDKDWQALIFPALDRLLDLGFGGVYLDIIDAYEYFEPTRPSAAADMAAFVANLSAYAKARNPDFWIVPQNGTGLLTRPDYRAVIDALGKEDLYFGEEGDGIANSPQRRAEEQSLLSPLGKPVFVIEYLTDEAQIGEAATLARASGFSLFVGQRALDRPGINP